MTVAFTDDARALAERVAEIAHADPNAARVGHGPEFCLACHLVYVAVLLALDADGETAEPPLDTDRSTDV